MERSKRLRRVVILAGSFTRNLAYFRHAIGLKDQFPRTSEYAFWVTMTNNWLDIAILDWCKLIADHKDKHCWYQVIDKPDDFEREMIDQIRVKKEEFEKYCKEIRRYRDKFVAHLDADEVMDIPKLDLAEDCVKFYFHHLVSKEVEGDVKQALKGLPTSIPDLNTLRKDEERAASIILGRALPPRP